MNKYDTRYLMLQEEKLTQIIKKQKRITEVSQEFNVSRQTIHKWLNRYKRFGVSGLIRQKRKNSHPAHNRTSPEIEQLIVNLSREHFYDGVETLSDRLQFKFNLTLHPTTIYRILKRKEVRYGEYQTYTKKRWKKKLFAHQIPGKELQMDTKYPYGYKEGKVIYTIIDDATRWVFAWSYEKANQENTLDFLEKVLKRSPFPIRKIRTDQGKEFIAIRVKDFLKKQNIEYRNNTPYCPEENGKIERFHRTLQEKVIDWSFYPKDTLDEMQYKLSLFLHYYNYRKKHRGLGMDGKTPIERLSELAGVNLTLQCYNG